MPELKTDKKSCHKCHKVYDKKLKKRKVCQCHAITYCGQECQVEDWPRHMDNCVPVMVNEVGEKGRGLVAARDIKMGERILIDSAVISLKSTFDGVIPWKVVRSLKVKIHALPAEKAAEFHNLESYSCITFSERNLKTLRKEECFNEMKTFRSNRRFEKEGCVEVLFFVLSLMNHSCAPNVEECPLPKESKDQETETVEDYELRAVRDISKGEEITIFYLVKVKSLFLNQQDRQIYLKKLFGFNCKCSVCCGDIDDQDSIIEKMEKIFVSPDLEVLFFRCSSKKYYTNLDQWKRMAIKGAILTNLSQKLHIGSVEAKMATYASAARAAQFARVQVLLERAMDAWKELVMKTGFEQLTVEYDKMKELVAKWAKEFVSKKPPTKKEIDAFSY